ncbi:hypothetical protein [Photobacterium kasasachensis]|uniref:hypothetical protein n=1 Tax=Photobacterium kasasachensis TaxID=2910240 RepID=UPI003D1126B7
MSGKISKIKFESLGLFITALGVIFTGLQIHTTNEINKGQNTIQLLDEWTTKAKIRKIIVNDELYIKWVKEKKESQCFWHYVLSSRLDLHLKIEYPNYPIDEYNSCQYKFSKDEEAYLKALFDNLLTLFTYYDKVATGYLLDQYDQETFLAQLKEYFIKESMKFNWMEGLGWKKFFPSYSKLLETWKNEKIPYWEQHYKYYL